MNPILLQKQLRDNANDLEEFCKELQHWGKEMKRKEEALSDSGPKQSETVKTKDTKPESVKKAKKVRICEPPATKKKTFTDYTAWEKFDAEAECGKIDDEDFDESDLTDEYDESKRDEAMLQKEKGNKFVKDQKWEEAIKCYTQAIACYRYDPVYYANRALCYLKLKQMKNVIEDCTLSLKLDATYVKAYQRRAAAREALNNLDGARHDLEQVLKYEQNNKESKAALDKLIIKIDESLEAQRPVSKFTASRGLKAQSTLSSGVNLKPTTVNEKPKTSENKLTKPVSRRIDDSKNVSFWPSGNDVVLVKPTKKKPHLQSKKPLKRIDIVDVDSSVKEESRNVSNSGLVTGTPRLVKNADPVAVKKHVFERKEPAPITAPVTEKEERCSKNLTPNEMNSSLCDRLAFPKRASEVFALKTDDLKVVEKTPDDNANNTPRMNETNLDMEEKKNTPMKTRDVTMDPKLDKDVKNFDNGVRRCNPIENDVFNHPKTSVQFHNSWKQLKDTNLKYQYLSRHVPPSTLPCVFKESLDSETFSEFIRIMADHFIPNKDSVYEFLSHLTNVKRFSALTMFMSTNDKNNLWKIIDYIKQDEKIEKIKVDELVDKYEL